MESRQKICLLLCLFGLLKELRPSEAFVTEFLTGWKNVTLDEVYQVVFPVWTYSYLALLVVVFLVTDYLLYQPVVVLEGVCGVATWCALIWGQGIPALQVAEFLYASATATQVAYSTYIYAQVPVEEFQLVTAYTQAALLTGRCLAGVSGQLLVHFGYCDFASLHYISLAFVTASTVVALFLPSVSQSVYFHRRSAVRASSDPLLARSTGDVNKTPTTPVYLVMWSDLVDSFSNGYALKWSLWWAFATCGYFQVTNYVQALWESIVPWEETVTANSTAPGPKIFNGAVESVHTLLGALATVGVGYAPVNWSAHGEGAIAAMSFFQGAMLYLAATADVLWVAYVGYVAFGVSYSVLITIASSEVAKGLKQESYGLVFGINTFLALLLQTVLTVVVADRIGLALDPKSQFMVYGGYYVVLGAAFSLTATYTACRGLRDGRN